MSSEKEPTKLDRFGIKWQGQRNPICVPMDDGYWTPWHEALERISELKAGLREMLEAEWMVACDWADHSKRTDLLDRMEELLEPPR